MYTKTRTNVHNFNFHLVWVTKYRKPIFINDIYVNEMKAILESISITNGVTIKNMEVMEDHVHMLISFPPHFTPASVVKSFKGGSAREWFKIHPETKSKLWGGHLWSPSYFMSTLGDMSQNTVDNYISNQKNTTPEEDNKVNQGGNSPRH